MSKEAEFCASLLQVLLLHDPSEIIILCWFAAQCWKHCIFVCQIRCWI